MALTASKQYHEACFKSPTKNMTGLMFDTGFYWWPRRHALSCMLWCLPVPAVKAKMGYQSRLLSGYIWDTSLPFKGSHWLLVLKRASWTAFGQLSSVTVIDTRGAGYRIQDGYICITSSVRTFICTNSRIRYSYSLLLFAYLHYILFCSAGTWSNWGEEPCSRTQQSQTQVVGFEPATFQSWAQILNLQSQKKE